MGESDLALGHGAHVGQIYRSFNEQKDVILPFFKEGLRRGEHCLLISDHDAIDSWFFELQACGVDVKDERERGALEVIDAAQWRSFGDFRSLRKAREVLSMLKELQSRFAAVRIAGDARWNGQPPISADQLCHWEATANLVFEGQNAQVICQYDLSVYSPAEIHAALRTHKTIINRGVRCSNPYYEAPRILANEPHLNSCTTSAEAIHRMVVTLGSR